MATVLGIDQGTSSVKVVLIDESGRELGKQNAGYPLHKPRPGWVEQDPEDWWRAACSAVRSLLAETGADPGDVAGVALSGQINGAVVSDASGACLRNSLIWLDHRSGEECRWAEERAGDLLRDRAFSRVTPVNFLAKLLWLHRHEAGLLRRAPCILLPKDWLRLRLTGVAASEISDASVTAAFDLRRRQWSGEILDALELDAARLPAAVESTDVVGAVTPRAAAEIGLRPGTPVCAGGGDIPCMVLGSGLVSPGIAGLGIGTAAHAVTCVEELDPGGVDKLWPMCHPVPGLYAWLGCSYTGGASFTWAKEALGMSSYEEMTAAAETVPVASEGLFFMPWLEGSATPCPDPEARGGFIGLTLSHGRPEMIRAVMEGVVFELRNVLECFAGIGISLQELRIGEGGSRSALWRQIQADVFGRELQVIDTEDLSAVGAALIAGVGCGLFEDFDDACGRVVKLGETVRPGEPEARAYAAAFARYERLYPTMKDWFHGAQ